MSSNNGFHRGIVGEASALPLSSLPRHEREAVERAQRQAGTVDMPDMTPGEHAARVRASLQHEKKTDEEFATTLSGEVRAKYKIEVTFVEGRTVQGPNKLGIQIWESGKRFNGGGDELAYWCKDNRPGYDDGCWSVITGDCIVGGFAMCPGCKRTINAELLTNMKIGNVTSQNLAKELAKLFRQLNSNADIYLKYHKTDVHYIAMEREKGPEVAARLKGMHIYPLKNILKDTAAGADLAKRFLAFITS